MIRRIVLWAWRDGVTAAEKLRAKEGLAYIWFASGVDGMDFGEDLAIGSASNFGLAMERDHVDRTSWDIYNDDPQHVRVGSYIDFVTRLLFWTGVSFETPLVVMCLARFRIVRANQLIRWWRIAIVGAFVIAAVVTPTWDPVTQSVVAGPIIVLYFLGIGLAWIVQPKRPE